MSFYPEHTPVPATLTTSVFVARPLRAADAVIDYAAYMASPDTIRIHSGGRWPITNFTVDDNRLLAAQHEQDHQSRHSFTFLLLTPDQCQSLGCLYVLPLVPFLQRVQATDLSAQFSAATPMVTFWLRQATDTSNLADHVVLAIDHWLATEWPWPDYVFRVNEGETRSIRALEHAGLQRRIVLDLPFPPYRYFFYGH